MNNFLASMPHGIDWHCCLLGVAKVHIFRDLTKYK